MRSKLSAIVAGQLAPGIYHFRSRAPVHKLTAETERAGWRLFCVDGAEVRDKATFLAACATAMQFPAYFGHNWDAFEECLTDLSWAPASGHLLLYNGFARFARQDPAAWATALDILRDVVGYWDQQAKPFAVLLRKSQDAGHINT
jgi:hypothetical protein